MKQNAKSAQVVVVVHECICEETCSYTMHVIRQKDVYWISNFNQECEIYQWVHAR